MEIKFLIVVFICITVTNAAPVDKNCVATTGAYAYCKGVTLNSSQRDGRLKNLFITSDKVTDTLVMLCGKYNEVRT